MFVHFIRDGTCVGSSGVYSTIHKAARLPTTIRNAVQRLVSHSRFKGFFRSTGIVPGKVGNSSVGGSVNHAVNSVFTLALSETRTGTRTRTLTK